MTQRLIRRRNSRLLNHACVGFWELRLALLNRSGAATLSLKVIAAEATIPLNLAEQTNRKFAYTAVRRNAPCVRVIMEEDYVS